MKFSNKPYSESCVQNREPILKVIRPLFSDKYHVLEIGSGTGQHAVYFAKHIPHLIWQASDQLEYHDGIKMWLSEASLENTLAPIQLNVTTDTWPVFNNDNKNDHKIDAIFSANAVHIMSWKNVVDFMKNAGALLPTDGLLVFYGPFNYNNSYTSESNARFDIWLKQQNPQSAIRDFEEVGKLAKQAGMSLQNDFEMPANNRILCWKKIA